MLDTANSVRSIYLSTLNGHLTYGGKNVPVYGQTPFSTTPQMFVIIGNITEVSDNTNHSFGNDVEVVIDIYSEQYMVYENSIVDNISSQILNLLIPAPNVNGFSDANFIVYPTARTSSRYLSESDGQNFYARKIITISNLVNQK